MSRDRVMYEARRWATVVLLVMVVVVGLYLPYVKSSADDARDAARSAQLSADKAAAAAENARTDLADAIAASQAGPGAQVNEAVRQTGVIYRILCAQFPQTEGC